MARRNQSACLWISVANRLRGRWEHARQGKVALALHKPRRRDDAETSVGERRYRLLPGDLPWLFPAGRLDADSRGC